jgi:hypothetical protein
LRSFASFSPCAIIVRHGYPWVPTARFIAVPDKWVRPIRRPADLTVGPTDLICGPEDLPEDSSGWPYLIQDLECTSRCRLRR